MRDMNAVVAIILILLGLELLGWVFQNLGSIFSVIIGIALFCLALWWFVTYIAEIILAVILFAVAYFVASFFTATDASLYAIATALLGVFAFSLLTEWAEKCRKIAADKQPDVGAVERQ